jgi:CspA family cold shock protein
MPTGTIKYFNGDRGYGFVKSDEGGPDVFVHIKDVRGQRELHENERVQFDITADEQRGKTKATGVRVLS